MISLFSPISSLRKLISLLIELIRFSCSTTRWFSALRAPRVFCFWLEVSSRILSTSFIFSIFCCFSFWSCVLVFFCAREIETVRTKNNNSKGRNLPPLISLRNVEWEFEFTVTYLCFVVFENNGGIQQPR